VAHKFKLDSIDFVNFGQLSMKELTIIIGPNNSGKSLAIKELLHHTTRIGKNDKNIISDVSYSLPEAFSDAIENVNAPVHKHSQNNTLCFRVVAPKLDREHMGFVGTSTDEFNANYWGWTHQTKRDQYCSVFGAASVLYLSTELRISLANEANNLKEEYEESSILQRLYNLKPEDESKIKRHVKEVFGKDIHLDFTVPQKLCFRVDSEISNIPPDPRDARPVLAKIPRLDDQGDGIRSYVGMCTALLSVVRPLTLVDEPEAFLHPPQATHIGRLIADCCGADNQIVVSTHSPEVLRGLMEAKKDTRLLRIQRTAIGSKITALEPEILREIVDHPLSGSSQALEGLFAEAVVVVEGDADGRIYAACLSQLKVSLGIQFVVADNKQTVAKLVNVYKHLGVPCTGIVDIDLLSVETEFTACCRELHISEEEILRLNLLRRGIALEVDNQSPIETSQSTAVVLKELELQHIELTISMEQNDETRQRLTLEQIYKSGRRLADSTKKWKSIKANGIFELSDDAVGKFNEVADRLSEIGICIAPFGELEAIFSEFGLKYRGNKREWFVDALKFISNLSISDDSNLGRFLRKFVGALGGSIPDTSWKTR